jgi:trans-2,3-dihydro-3-hydroxyanthranilate isomerase
MQRRYITVDVFTDRAFGGNPLAVVLDAQGLTTAQMQAIAIEFNYSETTFVLPAREAGHDAEVRIFTVRSEIPFAGHPNVGTAFVLASHAAAPPRRLTFEEQAAACLSLSASDIKTDRHVPHVVSVGLPFLVVELASREALLRAQPSAEAFARTLPLDGSVSIYLYTRDVLAAEAPCDLQARMFHPGGRGSLSEDPATGSATVAAAALFADIDPMQDGELRLTIGQGFDMGRPSLLLTRVVKQAGRILSAHVGGRCAPMMQGTLWLEGEAK